MEARRVTTKTSRKKPKVDRWRYGWRYVRRVSANGAVRLIQVPTTLEDFLHPEEEDFRVQTQAHDDDCLYLKCVINVRLPADGAVLSDCRVDWGVPGMRAHGPDIAAFRGVRRNKDWATFYVAREKAKPLFNIEVTSPDTRLKDVETKVEHYYLAGVPYYYIVDAVHEEEFTRVLELIAYRRGKTAYVRMKPDKQGRFLIKTVGLLLGTEGGRACCFDAKTGERIGDYAAIARERQEAQQEARAAQQAKAAADEQIRLLQEEIRRLRGGR
jgi:Uma2 family endonuclease